MTRDEAVRAGVFALANWPERQHGKFCPCSEGDRFGEQAAALVDALAAEGIVFEGFVAISPGGRVHSSRLGNRISNRAGAVRAPGVGIVEDLPRR